MKKTPVRPNFSQWWETFTSDPLIAPVDPSPKEKRVSETQPEFSTRAFIQSLRVRHIRLVSPQKPIDAV